MPLYRRGPKFSAPHLYDVEWPMQHVYGPPDDRLKASPWDHSREFDLRLFSMYFLVAETLATFVGYRITQHCLKGCRVRFLSPTNRMWIGVLYCWLKINLIDYAFHDTAYFKCSLFIVCWYFVYAVMALGFHFGPLQFLFYDYIPHSKMTRSLYQRVASICREVSTRWEVYVLQRLVCFTSTDEAVSTIEVAPLVAHTTNGVKLSSLRGDEWSRISLLFGREVEVQIDLWNRSLCQQWCGALVTAGRDHVVAMSDRLEAFECRFLFVMQHDGLLLGFFMTTPTATVMVKLTSANVTPFELILHYYGSSNKTTLQQIKPVFLYAESPLLVGRTTKQQKAAIHHLLSEFNASQGYRVDVPLRSLRCKNFVDAGIGQIVKKKHRQQQNLGSAFQDSFG